MSQPRPVGFHVEYLDTALLRQIVETDIDTAVHRLMRDGGKYVDDDLRRKWESDVIRAVQEGIQAMDAAVMMPQDVDRLIAREIAKVMESVMRPCSDAADIPADMRIRPTFALHRHALVLFRWLFEKRSE